MTDPDIPGREAEEMACGGSVRGLAAQLREVAERLRDPGLDDEQAAELARKAAELVARAGNEIDRALREDDPGGE
jgi:hypothetical protein